MKIKISRRSSENTSKKSNAILNLITKNIRTKLLFFLLPICLAAIFIMGFISFENAKNTMQDEIIQKLQSIADLKEIQIKDTFSSINSDMYLLQNDYVIKPTISVLSENKNNLSNEESIFAKKILDEQFGTFLNLKNLYTHIYLLDKSGDVVYEKTNKHEHQITIEHENSNVLKTVFDNAKSENYLTDVFREHSEFVMYYGAPLYDLNDNFVGVIVLVLDMNEIFILIQDSAGLGKTGETLLGKNDGNRALFINPVRHDPDAALNRTVPFSDEIVPITRAVQGIEGSGFRIDYRGEPILAVWKYLPNLNWGLVVKMDSSEVMQPIYGVQTLGIFITAFFAIIITSLVVVVSDRISKPISTLRGAMTQIEQGNYDVKIQPSGNDEIYDLMHSTRKMVETMQQRQELNDGIMEEISNQKEELTDLIKALNESSIVAVTDKNGIITYANEKLTEISKYSKEELIGKNHELLKSGYHPDIFFKGMWKVISQGKVWRGDIKYKAKDGTYYWVRTTIVPFIGKDGKPEQFIRISTDITSQKFTEEKLEYALNKLGETDKLKEEFSTMVSHELKTPLTPIKGYCEILKEDGIIGKLTKDQHEAIDEIDRNASRLERLVGDILDAQKLDMGKMTFNPKQFALAEFLNQLKKDLNPFMKEKHIQFEIKNGTNIKLTSDPDRLRQVIDNLTKNAVDFVPADLGKIEIGTKYEDNNVIFYVKDNGVGIPLESQKHLFKKFYQVDTSHTRKHGGTGLGLVICKGIVESLGGKIWVNSQRGNGTEFCFSVPIKEREIEVSPLN